MCKFHSILVFVNSITVKGFRSHDVFTSWVHCITPKFPALSSGETVNRSGKVTEIQKWYGRSLHHNGMHGGAHSAHAARVGKRSTCLSIILLNDPVCENVIAMKPFKFRTVLMALEEDL